MKVKEEKCRDQSNKAVIEKTIRLDNQQLMRNMDEVDCRGLTG